MDNLTGIHHHILKASKLVLVPYIPNLSFYTLQNTTAVMYFKITAAFSPFFSFE